MNNNSINIQNELIKQADGSAIIENFAKSVVLYGWDHHRTKMAYKCNSRLFKENNTIVQQTIQQIKNANYTTVDVHVTQSGGDVIIEEGTDENISDINMFMNKWKDGRVYVNTSIATELNHVKSIPSLCSNDSMMS